METCGTSRYKGKNNPMRCSLSNRTLDHEEIIRLYVKEGLSVGEVADHLCCSPYGVRHALILNNVTLRVGAKRTDTAKRLGFEPTKEWMEDLLSKHDSAASAAKNVNIPYPTFVDWMRRFEILRERWRGGPRDNNRRQEIPIEEAIQLSDDGVTYQQLATNYGVSPGVVMRRMKEAGHRAPRNKHQQFDLVFNSISFHKRKVLRELDIHECEICGERDVLDYCHIVADKDGGPIAIDNCLVLCPNHHRKYHADKLSKDEMAKIAKKVRKAGRLYTQ